MHFIDKIIKKNKSQRTVQLTPVLRFLTKLKITANIITFFRSFIGPLFVVFFPIYPKTFFIILIAAYLLDLIDGSLARFQKVAGDRGKFWDVFVDHTNYVFPVFTLLWFTEFDPRLISYHLLIVPIVYLLATIFKSERTKTDWIIHPYYSIVYFKPIMTAMIGFFAFNLFNFVNQTLFVFNVLMTVYTLFYIVRLKKRWAKII